MYNPESWANHWDKQNPTDFKKRCEESRALQEDYKKTYEKKMADLQKIKDLQPKEKK
jgi:hypothetical protein